VIRWLVKKFRAWNIRPCPNCGCRETDEIVKDMIDYHVCETEIICANCKHTVNYWAYGNYEEPVTRTEYIKYWWHVLSPWAQLKARYYNWKWDREMRRIHNEGRKGSSD
jgi:hypothetical protein